MNTFVTTEFKELLDSIPQANTNPPINTIAHIFRHEQKENFISDWLAFLLNPEYIGTTEPLVALLQLASAVSPAAICDVSILREAAFEDQRRIDFIIETDSHIIGIENEIWSDLQKNQLRDYETQLKKMADTSKKELILILLYPQRNEFCNSLKKDKQYGFNLVTYEDLVCEFKQIRLNIFENLRAAVLMEDFILHMEEYIMKEPLNTEFNLDMWRFEVDNREKLNKLKAALKAESEQFNTYIKNRIEALVSDRDDWEIRTTQFYVQLYKKSWDKCQVHFELLKKEGDGLVPSELTVVLHTCERRSEPRTAKLWEMGNSTEEKIAIRYDSQENFESDMGRVFEALENLIQKNTDKIDFELNSSPKVSFKSLK